MSTKGCTRPNLEEDDRLCFCPRQYGENFTHRMVLAQPFINGWVGETWMARAHAKAADPNATEEDLRKLLWDIEDAANGAYMLWRGMQ